LFLFDLISAQKICCFYLELLYFDSAAPVIIVVAACLGLSFVWAFLPFKFAMAVFVPPLTRAPPLSALIHCGQQVSRRARDARRVLDMPGSTFVRLQSARRATGRRHWIGWILHAGRDVARSSRWHHSRPLQWSVWTCHSRQPPAFLFSFLSCVLKLVQINVVFDLAIVAANLNLLRNRFIQLVSDGLQFGLILVSNLDAESGWGWTLWRCLVLDDHEVRKFYLRFSLRLHTVLSKTRPCISSLIVFFSTIHLSAFLLPIAAYNSRIDRLQVSSVGVIRRLKNLMSISSFIWVPSAPVSMAFRHRLSAFLAGLGRSARISWSP
jgi:hypothetical protein